MITWNFACLFPEGVVLTSGMYNKPYGRYELSLADNIDIYVQFYIINDAIVLFYLIAMIFEPILGYICFNLRMPIGHGSSLQLTTQYR